MNQEINSPFRYAGGKFYARKLILQYIVPHASYVEPFAGGASIFFAKPKATHSWLNDIDSSLINTLTVIRNQPQKLIEALKEEVATKERYSYYKLEFIPRNDFEKALRWFYLNRTSYSGIMNTKNQFWGYGEKYSMRPENWPRNILRTSHKLQNVKLTSMDFEQVLEQVEDETFLFIDPPYYNADQEKFYNHSFTHADHLRLSEKLKQHAHRIKFLLTYDNCPEVRELYCWAQEKHEQEWFYTLNRTDDQRKNGSARRGGRYKGKELFILNYETTPILRLF